MSENVYITKTLIDEESYSELDFVMHDKFNFDYENQEDFITIEKGNASTSEAHPIEIDDLIKRFQEMKAKGATHVEIEHHVDHIGYDISAWKIEKSSQVEIDEYENKRNKKKNKEQKISELRNQIREIENE